ncbi:MAG: hypothetical protein JOZ64_16555 [Solirubrobacterales bacterium]|nr:hypothetical protein [Solirubrobacterales bacterium]
MAERGGRDLLREWQKLMDSVVASARTVGEGADVPGQLLEPLQRQLELVQEVFDRERGLQRRLAGQLLAPFDAAFDLLEESGLMLRRQAEALEAAGRGLQDTASLMKTQADLFDRTIGALREPAELAKAMAGLERRPSRRARRGRSGNDAD